MADGFLKEKDAVSENSSHTEPKAQGESAGSFVIRRAPTAVSNPSEDSIYYAENATTYADAGEWEAAKDIQVSGAMLCGNISLLSEEDINRASETYNLVVAGKGGMPLHFGRKVHYYEALPTEEKFYQLFDAFDIDTVWYISGYADCQNGMHDEMKVLDSIMDACVKNAVSKLIVVTSITSLNFQPKYDIMGQVVSRAYASGEAFAVAQLENYIRYCAKSQGIKTIILRAPYIASNANRSNFLGHIFSSILHSEKLVFPYCPENKIDFLSSSDLMELFLDISEESADSTATYSVASGYHYTWKDLENEILKVKPDAVIEYEDNEDLSSLLRQVEDCHLTFIGPHIPDAETNAYDAVLRRVGYKYYVSKLSTTFSFADDSIDIRLEWENDGSAPLYWDWPVMIKIFDHSGTLVYWETLDLKLSELVPGKTISTVTKVPYLDEIRDGLSVGISIKSYDGKDSVMLAMDMDREIMEDS